MLKLHRDHIERYATDASMANLDAIIENYSEIFLAQKNQLEATIAFFEKLKTDAEFRQKITSDRGMLFEYFYYDQSIDRSLYEKLRKHTSFKVGLSSSLTEIKDITENYYTQHQNFHPESPSLYFKRKLSEYQQSGDRIAATRMLMGLFRSGVTVAPDQPFDVAFIKSLTPRLLLYVADYSKAKQINLAESAWRTLLDKYANDNAAIVAHMRLATMEENRKNLKAALKHLEIIEKTFLESPQLPAVILRQGDLLTQMGKNGAARQKYEYILKVQSWRGLAHARALFQTGQSYFAEKKFAEAHGYYERTFLAYSQFADCAARAYLEDAKTLLAMGSNSDALATLKDAISTLSKTADAELIKAIKAKIAELQPNEIQSTQI